MTGETPDPPLIYQAYLWRKTMNMSYAEFRSTPFDIIKLDLDMMKIENSINQAPRKAK